MSNKASNLSTLPTDEQRVTCEVCIDSIPLSESNIMEAEEYIAYFCGLECFDTWVHQKDQPKTS